MLRTREPDIETFLKVLKGAKSNGVRLFELFMDPPVYEYFAERKFESNDPLEVLKLKVDACYNAGYDYTTTHACALHFETNAQGHLKSVSANEGGIIKDWDSFHKYVWPDANTYDYSVLDKIAGYLPNGMKLCVMGPGGVLENVTALIGYEDMCIMSFEEPELLQAIFDKVGQILVDYYSNAVTHETVAFIISNDDWGFNTQTFLSVAEMRNYVFPWHKKIVAIAHAHNMPAVLHSCGYMQDVFGDIVNDMQYDAKHSFEDNILSVEESYKRFGDKITILGGLDLNFLITSDEDIIKNRCKALLELTRKDKRYMMGTGNSLAYYIPISKIETMIKTALEWE